MSSYVSAELLSLCFLNCSVAKKCHTAAISISTSVLVASVLNRSLNSDCVCHALLVLILSCDDLLKIISYGLKFQSFLVILVFVFFLSL